MNATAHNRPDNHPSITFLYLLLTVFIGAFVFGFIGLGVGLLVYGGYAFQIFASGFSDLNEKALNLLSIIQIFSALGTFVIPALLLNRIERRRKPLFNLQVKADWRLYALVVLLMFVYAPFFEWTIVLNEQLKLPDALHGVEQWMRAKEDQTGVITNALLSRPSIGAFITNLFMVGILAAVGEEFIFRGCLQQILINWLGKPHLAIWLTAIVFSAIHIQFFGFLPRMLIGALCGYLYFYGRRIWLPILAHFINNATAIVIAFYLTRQGKPLDYWEYKSEEWPMAVASVVLGTILLLLYRSIAHNRKTNGNAGIEQNNLR
ncbi:CPBP family intramembrane glutamic endopeptidase [Olivibacter ginsenosidimutans]|uniref:CPBP family intramembrane glutamic endopeptidase n=1 Tax=Olivibacter ginsenosidimutans TaxID=1176537 RepID=UPI0031EDEC17